MMWSCIIATKITNITTIIIKKIMLKTDAANKKKPKTKRFNNSFCTLFFYFEQLVGLNELLTFPWRYSKIKKVSNVNYRRAHVLCFYEYAPRVKFVESSLT